jgi:glycosyltransferase involved in cell wall biosynthesis
MEPIRAILANDEVITGDRKHHQLHTRWTFEWFEISSSSWCRDSPLFPDDTSGSLDDLESSDTVSAIEPGHICAPVHSSDPNRGDPRGWTTWTHQPTPSYARQLMLSVVSFYGLLPVDLRATAAVPRLNAQLLTSLGAAHPDWDVLAISPEAKALPGVEAIGVALPASATAKLRLSESRVGRRLLGKKAATPQSFSKALWAEAASAQLAASRPDRPSTVVICTHAEAVLAVRRAMPRSRIVHWIHTPVVWGFLDAGLAADGAVVPSVAVYRDTWRRLGNQYPPPMWIIPNWIDVDAFHPLRPEERRASRAALGLDQNDLVVAFIDRHWIKGARVIEQALLALPPFDRRVVLLSAGEPRTERRILVHNREVWNLGLLPPDELHKMYGVADAGVVPSVVEENFPLASLEMMACSLPVIASRVGGVPEVISDRVTGWLIDIPNAVDSWVDALVSLLTDAEQRSKLGAAAMASVLERFSAKRAQENWSRVLNQLGSD